MEMTGAELWVKALHEEHVDTLFAYPGGQAVDLFNALYGEESIQVVLPRHEQGLVHAADGYARASGKTGVCLVTSGPGAANLVTGIATAHYDSVPLVCFTGQVPTRLMGNDAFQEADIVGMTRSICKYAVTVRHRDGLAAVIKKAFYLARTGRPGVVVVDLPKDIQQAYGSGSYPKEIHVRGCAPASTAPENLLDEVMIRLQRAQKPLLLAGGGIQSAWASRELTQFAEQTGIPVVTTLMGKGAIPSTHALYVGNLGIHGSFAANTAVSECDLLLAFGTRFSDRVTGNPDTFAQNAEIIRIDIDPASASREITAALSVTMDVKQAAGSLLLRAAPLPISAWRMQINQWKQEQPTGIPDGSMTPESIMREIGKAFPRALVCADVGQNQMWAAQFLELGEHRRLLTSGGFGTMGYALPAAIGAKLACPETDVIAVAGDGGIQMNIQELAAAVCYELPIVICILNNGYLGNVRQWQELFYERRYSGTCMRRRKSCPAVCGGMGTDCPAYTPDFVRLAQSYGAEGVRVTEASALQRALETAKQNPKTPTVIECIIEPECNVLPIVPPGCSLTEMMRKGANV